MLLWWVIRLRLNQQAPLPLHPIRIRGKKTHGTQTLPEYPTISSISNPRLLTKTIH